MERVYALSRRTVTLLAAPEVAPGYIRATRSASIILRGRIAALNQATRGDGCKRKKYDPSRCSKSPRTVYKYDTTESMVGNSANSSTGTDFCIPESSISQDTSFGQLGLHEVIPPPVKFEKPSVFPRAKSPSKLGSNNTLSDTAKESVIDLPNGLADASFLLRSLRGSQIEQGKRRSSSSTP